MVSLFNGVVRPYASLPIFWRYWMYYVNPSTWWTGGVLSSVLANQPVNCTPEEATLFPTPPGETCASYAADFLSVSPGYLLNPEGSDVCRYCPYRDGEEYLATLNISPSDKWRDFGIFLVFVFSNWALVYFFIYTVRVKGWTFGMGPLFGLFGKAVDGVKGLFSRRQTDIEEDEA
jgi:ATP-binding cassette, subfamily G (WHITE), member 2, SNQ2